MTFQFRCGFSVPCDVNDDAFLSVVKPVSIPLWIFCSLRLRHRVLQYHNNASFNSVVDFLFPATVTLSAVDVDGELFQFRCGFSVPCDRG